MFCGCPLVLRRPAQRAYLPGLPRPAGRAAGAQRPRRALRRDGRAGARLRHRRSARSSHRKHYFYPDIPKGVPDLPVRRRPCARAAAWATCDITRVHLEEDAAKLVHIGTRGRIHGADASIVDFNRGGTPLIEIVTEPDLRSAEQAREWLKLLRSTLRQLGVSDANMDEGSLRSDANVSVRPAGTTRSAPRPS